MKTICISFLLIFLSFTTSAQTKEKIFSDMESYFRKAEGKSFTSKEIGELEQTVTIKEQRFSEKTVSVSWKQEGDPRKLSFTSFDWKKAHSFAIEKKEYRIRLYTIFCRWEC